MLRYRLRRFAGVTCGFTIMVLLFCVPLWAGPREYEPFPGQTGKDVVWMPTEETMAERMLDLAGVTPRDTVFDLGSGDGRLVIAAARRGARAVGIEYNPELVKLSWRMAAREGVAGRARFIHDDIFKSEFSEATVITLFLLPELNMRLRPAILNLKAGTRIVSNSFNMEDWVPDRTVVLGPDEGCGGAHCRIHFWIVPAKVEGCWKLPQGELTIRQDFQMLTGDFRTGARTIPLSEGKLQGEEIRFRIGEARYIGRVNGDTMSGTVHNGGNRKKWAAAKVGR